MSETPTNLTFLNLLQELCALGEFANFAQRTWTRPIGKADRENARSVLLIPGFLAGDPVLYPFSHWLRACGHRVFFPGILTNIDCPRHAIDRLSRILSDFSDQAQDKLVVIGHSLGGIYARELARRFPDRIGRVILLGAPIKEPLKHSNPYVPAIAVARRQPKKNTFVVISRTSPAPMAKTTNSQSSSPRAIRRQPGQDFQSATQLHDSHLFAGSIRAAART